MLDEEQINIKKYISVIVPLYYGRRYIPDIIFQLERCADKAEDCRIQLVLSNDSPKQKIGDQYSSSKISIKIIQTDANGGIHRARIRGFQNSDGNFILFLDQDDKISPDYFVSQLSKIGAADAVVCDVISGGRRKYNLDRPLNKAVSRRSMVNEGNMILSPGQVLLRRKAVPECWINNPMQNNGADDWLLWLCMHSEKKLFVINENVLFIREVHYHNASSNSLKMILSEQEAVKIIEENHLLYKSERKILKELLPRLEKKRMIENEKWKQMFLIVNNWFQSSSQGQSAAQYLKRHNIKKIAVYGYGYLGKTLLENLESENIEVAYVIDKNAAFLDLNKKCCTLEQADEPVDAVIISLIKDFQSDEISSSSLALEKKIKEKMKTTIMWLEEVVAGLK